MVRAVGLEPTDGATGPAEHSRDTTHTEGIQPLTESDIAADGVSGVTLQNATHAEHTSDTSRRPENASSRTAPGVDPAALVEAVDKSNLPKHVKAAITAILRSGRPRGKES